MKKVSKAPLIQDLNFYDSHEVINAALIMDDADDQIGLTLLSERIYEEIQKEALDDRPEIVQLNLLKGYYEVQEIIKLRNKFDDNIKDEVQDLPRVDGLEYDEVIFDKIEEDTSGPLKDSNNITSIPNPPNPIPVSKPHDIFDYYDPTGGKKSGAGCLPAIITLTILQFIFKEVNFFWFISVVAALIIIYKLNIKNY